LYSVQLFRAVSNVSKTIDWREGRRRSARQAIIDAAWSLVAEEGLAGLSLRDLARRAGISTPTVYSYFDSKNAIYDAMFAQAAANFAERMAEPFGDLDPRELLVAGVRRFSAYCTSDPARYQLLFQHTLPGFEPSAESYAPAVAALEHAHGWLARNDITEARHLDLWTALVTGLVDQQISNDPGGDRWTRLIDESIDMFVAHCKPIRVSRVGSSRPTPRKKG
jgi:AcrR family transcriptional regulator